MTDIVELHPDDVIELVQGGTKERRSKGNGAEAKAQANQRTRPEFAILINGARQETVGGLIAQGTYLNEAKEELRGEYEKMLEEDLEIDAGAARKLRKISRHPMLAKRENFHALPASMSKLYELAFLTPEHLQTLIDEGVVHAKLTLEQAHDLRAPTPAPLPHQCALCADTARLPDGHQWCEHADTEQLVEVEDQDATADLVEELVQEVGRIFGRPRGAKPGLRQKIERVRDERVHPDIRAMLARALREHADIAHRLADEIDPPIQRRKRATKS